MLFLYEVYIEMIIRH